METLLNVKERLAALRSTLEQQFEDREIQALADFNQSQNARLMEDGESEEEASSGGEINNVIGSGEVAANPVQLLERMRVLGTRLQNVQEDMRSIVSTRREVQTAISKAESDTIRIETVVHTLENNNADR